MRRGAVRAGGAVRLARAPLSHGRAHPAHPACPPAPHPRHFLSRHKGRFKFFGMPFGDISPTGGGNAASGRGVRCTSPSLRT
ncbi:unnamed protein product [Leptosia nina]|uniref:Uncharacterized protein n=1 Tax=Leptosia nina TaxID=320188 RepID=A0AAV1J823_9NEOP